MLNGQLTSVTGMEQLPISREPNLTLKTRLLMKLKLTFRVTAISDLLKAHGYWAKLDQAKANAINLFLEVSLHNKTWNHSQSTKRNSRIT